MSSIPPIGPASKLAGSAGRAAAAGKATKAGKAASVANRTRSAAARRLTDSTAERAAERLGDARRRPDPAAGDGPAPGKEQRKADAKQALKDVAAGAIQGLPQGGWVGAAKGAAVAAATSAPARSTLKRAAIGIAAGCAVIIAVQFLIITTAISTVLGVSIDTNSASAATADGNDVELVNSAWRAHATNVPPELVTWILANEPDLEEKLPELGALLMQHLPDPNERNLRNGSFIDSEGRMRLGETDDDLERQKRTSTGYIDALTHESIGMDEQRATSAFEQARLWALGESFACGPGSGAPGGTGSAAESANGESITLEGWGTITGEQIDNAIAIIGATKTYLADLPAEQQRHAALLALSNAMRESTLRNLGHGDEGDGVTNPDGSPTTSKGLFQQQDHWGALEDRMNPAWATTKFLYVMVRKPEWFVRPQEEVSYDVQVFRRDLIGEQVHVWPHAVALYELLEPRAKKLDPIPEFGVYDPGEASTAGEGPGSRGSSTASAPGAVCEGDSAPLLGELKGLPVDPASGAKITELYGPRVPPVEGASSNHRGIDIGYVGEGVRLYSMIDGTVTQSAWVGSYGNLIDITSDDGRTTIRYAHLAAASPLAVGAKVKAGDDIGEMGTTGASSGIHLHLEVHLDGEPQNPIFALGGWDKALAAYPIVWHEVSPLAVDQVPAKHRR